MAISLTTLHSRKHDLTSGIAQLRVLDQSRVNSCFEQRLCDVGLSPLTPTQIEILQVNVGKMCNMTCAHCHVDAGPDRTEIMTRETMEHCIRAARTPGINTVDITGGAPELNPDFFWFVEQLSELGVHIIDRCNLTILMTNPHKETAAFLAAHNVEIVCSLPHYRRTNTDAQRGDGTYDQSIAALQMLNALGYGQGDDKHRLTLVTNPVGAFLPPMQASIEQEWKRELLRNFNITFDRLFTITNMPISRFLEWLVQTDNLESYMQRLLDAYNPSAAANVMCRNTISVGWDGTLYDCDFNQMLEMPIASADRPHIRDFNADTLTRRTIRTAQHCFGCTAGAGSSCSGTVA
ncbi:MAG: arsenosugar biosynthesis radical SAM protein ArsS [Phycisphaerales bacterium]|nr:arsenosugar biosynthesis radical SAM protein ArsS [Phycisphaerales bacterium]